MSKLPEKFIGIDVQTPMGVAKQLGSAEFKINEIIDYLAKQEEFCDCDNTQSCNKCNH